jgi:hypothetical protein
MYVVTKVQDMSTTAVHTSVRVHSCVTHVNMLICMYVYVCMYVSINVFYTFKGPGMTTADDIANNDE